MDMDPILMGILDPTAILTMATILIPMDILDPTVILTMATILILMDILDLTVTLTMADATMEIRASGVVGSSLLPVLRHPPVLRPLPVARTNILKTWKKCR